MGSYGMDTSRLRLGDLEKVIGIARDIESHYANVQIVTNSRLIGKATEHRLYWLALGLLDLLDQVEDLRP